MDPDFDLQVWLDEIAARARGGGSQVRWCTINEAGGGRILSGLRERSWPEGTAILSMELGGRVPGPWDPFAGLVRHFLARLPAARACRLVVRAFPFRQEHAAMLAWAGLPPVRADTDEPPIPEDSAAWRHRSARCLADLIQAAMAGLPGVLVCRGAEFLPAESLALMDLLEAMPGLSLTMVNCFHRQPGPLLPRLDQHFRLLDSRARLRSFDEALPVSRLPAPGPAGLPALECLVERHCPRSAEPWLRHEMARLERAELDEQPGVSGAAAELHRLLARSLADQDRLEEAHAEIQSAWMELDAGTETRQGLAVLVLMSWIQSANNDATAAARSAWQAWNLARGLGDRAWEVRAAFAFLRAKLVDSLYGELLADIDRRLEKDFTELGWANHLALMLCRPAAVVRREGEQDIEEAMRRCREAQAISRAQGNYRRLATGWHMLAVLNQRRRRWTEAETCYRRSRLIMERWVPAQVLAHSFNGQGYYHFIRGTYDLAVRQFNQALTQLQNSQEYDEVLQTLVNLARVYLRCGQAGVALSLMETIISVLDQLEQPHLPLHPRQELLALLGIAACKAGMAERSREIIHRLDRAAVRGDGLQPGLTALWFRALAAAGLDDAEAAGQAFRAAGAALSGLAPGEQSGNAPLLLDHAEWLLAAGRDGAAEAAVRAAGLLDPEGHPREHRRLEALADRRPPPPAERLPGPAFDPAALLQRVERQRMLGQLRRSLKDSDFLRRWQEALARVRPEGRLLEAALRLIRQRWLVEYAAFFRPDSPPAAGDPLEPVLTAAAGQGWEGPRSGGDPEAPSLPGLEAWSWIPIQFDGQTHWILGVGTSRRGPDFGPAAHQHLVLAAHQLATILMVLQREEHISRSERLTALGGMVAGVAHEINTPLGIAVTGSSYLIHLAADLAAAFDANQLSRSMLGNHIGRISEAGQIIMRNLEQAERLVKSFKMVSADQTSEERRVFPLMDYLREIFVSLKARLAEKQVEVSFEGPEELFLDSYPGAIYQIMSNLAINSLFHGFAERGGGRIGVKVQVQGDQLSIRFEDDGAGIPAGVLPRIFNPFFTTRRSQGGTGLGLHVVHNLVEQVLGGSIEAESEPGRGTVFTLQLPKVAPRLDGGRA